ncbi:hypothetical protein FACS189427_08950 [Planctomycetales bacterium]|nr:hypothetical protein FACS189427_08950 [Planctomycetales bacterium]
MSKDARFFRQQMFCRFVFCAAVSCFIIAANVIVNAAQYETRNFTTENAPDLESAKRIAETAEYCRREMAMLWLGTTIPDWTEKCPIRVKVGKELGAGGATTFVFQDGGVSGWEMDIQGSEERILDSVLPHEITHIVLASHFRRPLPRWLDEGIATSVENESEKERYRKMLRHFISKDVQRCLPCRRMVSMKEYPEDVMPFYAQGFSTVEYLLLLGGQRKIVHFAETAMKTGWDNALLQHYGFANLGEFQEDYWVKWVAAGSPVQVPPALRPNSGTLLTSNSAASSSETVNSYDNNSYNNANIYNSAYNGVYRNLRNKTE